MKPRGRFKAPRPAGFNPEQENDLPARVQQLEMENEYVNK